MNACSVKYNIKRRKRFTSLELDRGEDAKKLAPVRYGHVAEKNFSYYCYNWLGFSI